MPQLKFPQALARSDLDLRVPASAGDRFTPMKVRAETDGEMARLHLLGHVGSEFYGFTARSVVEQLKEIDDSAELEVLINSPGGEYFEGVAIYNLLEARSGKTVVSILGLAASAASIIAMAGDEVRMSETGVIMIHNTIGFCYGNKSSMQETASTLAKFDLIMANLYANRSNLELDDVIDAMDAETFYSADEALEAGLIDEIRDYDEGVDETEEERVEDSTRN